MRVRLGWSGETGNNIWQKADVELQEADLTRIIADNELPDGLGDRLPTQVAYQLLSNECEALLLVKLVALGYPQDKASGRTGELRSVNNHIVTALKNKLGSV